MPRWACWWSRRRNGSIDSRSRAGRWSLRWIAWASPRYVRSCAGAGRSATVPRRRLAPLRNNLPDLPPPQRTDALITDPGTVHRLRRARCARRSHRHLLRATGVDAREPAAAALRPRPPRRPRATHARTRARCARCVYRPVFVAATTSSSAGSSNSSGTTAAHTRMEELAYQRWEGGLIAEEEFSMIRRNSSSRRQRCLPRTSGQVDTTPPEVLRRGSRRQARRAVTYGDMPSDPPCPASHAGPTMHTNL